MQSIGSFKSERTQQHFEVRQISRGKRLDHFIALENRRLCLARNRTHGKDPTINQEDLRIKQLRLGTFRIRVVVR